jgi:hypothetical protein
MKKAATAKRGKPRAKPRAASKPSADGTLSARRQLIHALLDQAEALLQRKKKDEALKCLLELQILAAFDAISGKKRAKEEEATITMRTGLTSLQLYHFQRLIEMLPLEGPLAKRIKGLFQEAYRAS